MAERENKIIWKSEKRKLKDLNERLLEFLGVKTKNCDFNVIYGKSQNPKTI